MDVQIIRLKFQSALHTGRRGIGSEESDQRLVADTLFAALITQLAQRAPEEVDNLIAQFPRREQSGVYIDGEAPFLLSSTFPYAGKVLFFPVPIGSLGAGVDKALKKVAYVSKGIFDQILAGKTLDNLSEHVEALQDGKVWVSKDESGTLPPNLLKQKNLWKEQSRPRVLVDRRTNASTIFHHGEVFFREGCGLWFGIHWHDLSFQSLFSALWGDLQALGIGGLRSYGLGAFSSEDGGEINLPDTGTSAVTLSRIHPAPDDLQGFADKAAAYRLSQVGGYMSLSGAKDVIRRTVTLVDEGAVLPASVQGCLVDVSPEGAPHPSWRYGLSFPVGINVGGEG